MKNFDPRQNLRLRALSEKVFSRLGHNIYLILSIMSVMLVFSGLVVGLLGRGWGAAWFLVFLGLFLGFFPCLRFIMNLPLPDEEDFEEEEDEEPYPDRDILREKEEAKAAEERKALEREAMLAMEEIRRRVEARKREEALRKEEERILREAKAREMEKLMEEERRRQEKEKARRKQNEENSAKWEKGPKKTVYKSEYRKQQEKGYFDGVKSSEELKKRYKELTKSHHPDNGGDAETLLKIQTQYRELEKFFKSYEKHHRR